MSIYLWEKEIKAGELKLWEKDIIAVYLWEKKIRPDEYKYQVNANTLFFCPFDTNTPTNLVTNQVISKRNWNSWFLDSNFVYDTANPTKTWPVFKTLETIFDLGMTNFGFNYTISVRIGTTYDNTDCWVFNTNPCGILQGIRYLCRTNGNQIFINRYYYTWGRGFGVTVNWLWTKKLHHLVFTQGKIYCDWILRDDAGPISSSFPNDWSLFTIGWHAANSSCSAQVYSNMILREYIIENRSRTGQEVLDYYNNTKTLFYQN